MNFRAKYREILSTLVTEEEGIEGVDVLPPEQESELDSGSMVGDNTKKLVDLTNILISSLRFKPSDEFRAYLKMPKFHNLSAFEKLTTIRNVLSDHPEKIIKEADEPESPVEEFGDADLKLTENDEMDILRLIIRALIINPHSLSITLKQLPLKVDADSYQDVMETIEKAIF